MTMASSPATRLPIDLLQLTPWVRAATACETLVITECQTTLLHGGATTNARVYRVSGEGYTQDRVLPWALILKEWRPRGANDDVTARNYWRREALAYQAAWLQAPRRGLRPARCFGTYAPDDTSLWLALEAVATPQPHPWPSAYFARAAQHLGQFNGHFAVQGLPTDHWLSRDWLRWWVTICEAAVTTLPQMRHHPLVRAHLTEAQVQALRQVWEIRDHWLATLDQMPPSLNHRDAFARNLLVDEDPETTVAIDWATVGIGPLGEDLAALLGGSLVFFELDPAATAEVAAQAWTQYLTGLRQSGWAGDPQAVRFSYTATLALRYGLGSALDVALVADEAAHAWAEQVLGHSITELMVNTATNLDFFLACAQEAVTLQPAR